MMKPYIASLILLLTVMVSVFGEGPAPTPTPHKRGWLGRVLHPFSKSDSVAVPQYKDPKLGGLTLELQITPQPIKISEVRQVQIKVILTNRSKRAIELDFPTSQRIEIYLMNTADKVLTKWSDNHAIEQKPGTVLIDPQEHIEYNEAITTRDLTPDTVFVAESFFPQYPELRVRQKFLTAR